MSATLRSANRSGGGFGLGLVEALAAHWGVRRAVSTTASFDMDGA